MMTRTTHAILGALLSIGCGAPFEEDDVGHAEAALDHGTIATQSVWRRMVHLPDSGCSGTLISPTHVLTRAVHVPRDAWDFGFCYPQLGDRVQFYTSGPTADTSAANTRTVVGISLPPGVNRSLKDVYDVNNNFADLAILVLSAPAPAGTLPATLAWEYPPDGDDLGLKVGSGLHDGSDNSVGLLRTKQDWTYSSAVDRGSFLAENRDTNAGDEGGPFLFEDRVLGVMSADVFEWEYRDKYTSIPTHIAWALGATGYTWPGYAPVYPRRLSGGRLQTVATTSHRTCQYACDRSFPRCVAYNFQTTHAGYPTCELLAVVYATYSTTGFTSAHRPVIN
jgi:hypothetical protein